MGIEFTIRYCNDKEFQVTGFDVNNIRIVDELLDTIDSEIIETLYQSKVNQYVSYNFVPAFIEKFFVNYTVRVRDKEHIDYFEYLLDKRIRVVNDLENLLETEVIK